jgi:hypothetical protein
LNLAAPVQNFFAEGELPQMEISRARHYCGYQIRAEPLEDGWRVVVQPSRPELPILSERVFLVESTSGTEAVKEAERRIDRVMRL